MASIRSKLTTAYAAALIASMTLFAMALWAARGASVDREVQRYVFAQADITLRIIRQAATAGEPVTVEPDSLVGPMLSPRLRTALDVLPDYVLVVDTGGRLLY